ncbi:hypothetical protein [Prosthecobacter sp.]|uniref:hypothetical protein n=1 Tax=Prosthecobacter sp. TaxID=1965333 RepID=UPI002AB9042D|nr:hypothetical protein [Prosthecobacter sp.]MDZ4404555.1 hypothetical protein [Prosthecobacter sp.]
MKQFPCLILVLLMSLSTTAQLAAEEQQVSIKLAKIVPVPQSLPATLLNDLNKRHERLDTWRSGIKEKVEKFNALGSFKPGSTEDALRRRDLEKLAEEAKSCSIAVKKFNAEVEALTASPSTRDQAAASWSRQWNAAENKKVLTALEAFKDAKLREWIENKAPKDRVPGTPSSLPPAASDMISANGTMLTFKDGFFDQRASDTKRENLLAFEAGKVLWSANMTGKVDQSQSLEDWFKGFLRTNPGLVEELKAARHQGEGLSDLGDLADAQSQFAHVFRARALGLGSKERQSELNLFKNKISPLLEK